MSYSLFQYCFIYVKYGNNNRSLCYISSLYDMQPYLSFCILVSHRFSSVSLYHVIIRIRFYKMNTAGIYLFSLESQ